MTEEEKQAVLKIAMDAKVANMKRNEYWQKVNRQNKPPEYTPEQMLRFITAKCWFRLGFTFDPENINLKQNPSVLPALLKYFTNNETELIAAKGICLTGGVGCGKSTLMRIFSENQKSSYVVISCRAVAQEYAEKGFLAIKKYFNNQTTIQNVFGHQHNVGICFDDLGTESEKKNFGNELNVMSEIILNRYDNPQLNGMTHFTTNLNAEQIEQYYGSRVRSRLREMVNTLTFMNEKDLRK